jgi:hypothetical protein
VRSAAKYLLPSFLRHQGKEKEFLPLIALIYADQEVNFLPSASISEISG